MSSDAGAGWPPGLPVRQVRIARPTDRLPDVVTFYIDALGHPRVEAENPYWASIDAVTFADPDGWHVVLAPSSGRAGSG